MPQADRAEAARALTLPRLPRSRSWPGKAPTPCRWTRHLVRAARSAVFSLAAIRPAPAVAVLPADAVAHASRRGWLAAEAQTGRYRLARRRHQASCAVPRARRRAPPKRTPRHRRGKRNARAKRQLAAGARRAGEPARLAAPAQGQGRPAPHHRAAVQRRRAAGGRLLARAAEPARHGQLVGVRPPAGACGASAPGVGVELSDTCVAARTRVHRALAAVGPELAGILVDVCCHDVGLEAAGRAQGWPQRAAKVVLQLALTRLARHYGLLAPEPSPGARRMRHWGDDGLPADARCLALASWRASRGGQRARIVADALDHGEEAVRALRRQVLLEAQLGEERARVGAQDLLGASCPGTWRTGWRSGRARCGRRCRPGTASTGARARAAARAPCSQARPGWRSRAPCWRRSAAPRAAAAARAPARSHSGSGPPSRRAGRNRSGWRRASWSGWRDLLRAAGGRTRPPSPYAYGLGEAARQGERRVPAAGLRAFRFRCAAPGRARRATDRWASTCRGRRTGPGLGLRLRSLAAAWQAAGDVGVLVLAPARADEVDGHAGAELGLLQERRPEARRRRRRAARCGRRRW